MSNEVIMWIVGTLLVPTVLGLIAKFFPKQKLFDLVYPFGYKIGEIIDSFGDLKFGEKIWGQVEEGIFRTLIETGIMFFQSIFDGMKKTKKIIEIGEKVLTDPLPDSNECPSKNENTSNFKEVE